MLKAQSFKHTIKSRFNSANATYDQHCGLQNMVCDQALNLLDKNTISEQVIVDLACGTGESTSRLMDQFPQSYCTGVDIAEKLLWVANNKLDCHKVTWIEGDFDQPLFQPNSVNLIFCNMGLQWATDLTQTLHWTQQSLVDHGKLLFTLPVDGNFCEIQSPYKRDLHSHASILSMLRSSNLTITHHQVNDYTVTFDSIVTLLQSIKGVGANAINTPCKSLMTARRLLTTPHHCQLTYKIGTYLTQKRST